MSCPHTGEPIKKIITYTLSTLGFWPNYVSTKEYGIVKSHQIPSPQGAQSVEKTRAGD